MKIQDDLHLNYPKVLHGQTIDLYYVTSPNLSKEWQVKDFNQSIESSSPCICCFYTMYLQIGMREACSVHFSFFCVIPSKFFTTYAVCVYFVTGRQYRIL